jgi:hypothetical protein
MVVAPGGRWKSREWVGNAYPIARLVPAGSVPNYQNPAYQGWYYGHMDWHDLFAWH